MDKVMVNDSRAIVMIILLIFSVLLLMKSIVLDTFKRLYRIYKWTDIRYKELMQLLMCIFCCTLATGCFDDAQRIATAGSSFSNWLEIGTMPNTAYHYMINIISFLMLPFDFVLFLYKMYHTEKGTPDKSVLAETVILLLIPMIMMGSHYTGQGVVYIIKRSGADDAYGNSSIFLTCLFLISILYLVYNTYSLKKGFDFTKLDIIKGVKSQEAIWGPESEKIPLEEKLKQWVREGFSFKRW